MRNSEMARRCGLVTLLFLLMAVTVAFVRAGESPYESIIERNVFGLKSPPAPPPPPDTRPPPPKITLTGITTMFGNKRALFKVQMPPKPPDPAHEQSFILAEGEREGDIEVLEIDDVAGSIKVNNFGTIMTVPFEKESNKTAGSPAPGTQPPPHPNPFARPPLPTAVNPIAPQGVNPQVTPGGPAGVKTIPIRPPRLPVPPGNQAQ